MNKSPDIIQMLRDLQGTGRAQEVATLIHHSLAGKERSSEVRKIIRGVGLDMPELAIKKLLDSGAKGTDVLVRMIAHPGEWARQTSIPRPTATQTAPSSAALPHRNRWQSIKDILTFKVWKIPVLPVAIVLLILGLVFGTGGETAPGAIPIASTAPQNASEVPIILQGGQDGSAQNALPERLVGQAQQNITLASFVYPGVDAATGELGEANTPYYYLGFKVRSFLQPDQVRKNKPMNNFNENNQDWVLIWDCIWRNYQPNMDAWAIDNNAQIPFDLTQAMDDMCGQ